MPIKWAKANLPKNWQAKPCMSQAFGINGGHYRVNGGAGSAGTHFGVGIDEQLAVLGNYSAHWAPKPAAPMKAL